jgi:nitrate reductase NapAB chaperone NapD
MPICSYLVLTEPGSSKRVGDALAGIPACDVVMAENEEILVLVTETESFEAEEALRRRVEATEGIHALLLTFGEVDPEAPIPDPVALGRTRKGPRHRGRAASGPEGGS